MSDDPRKQNSQDRKRINMSEGYEINYWTRQLGCTEHQLMMAVAAVGPQVDQVKVYLKDRGAGVTGRLPGGNVTA